MGICEAMIRFIRDASVLRRAVSIMIGKGVPSFQLNEINGLKGAL